MKRFLKQLSPVAALVAAVSSALPALAQDTTAANAQPGIGTLAKALERVPWDAVRRGPLLVVDPQDTHPAPKAPPLPPPRADGYLLRTIAARFGRKVVALPTLTVLAPTTMVVLSTKPGPLDLLSQAGLTDKMGLLLASLNAAQWRLIAGPQGLGLADLSPEQQPFFRLLLPETFRFQKGPAKETRRVLSPGERERVRLRVNRAAEMAIRVANEENLVAGFGRYNARPYEDTIRLVGDEEDGESPANTRAPLRQVVPSRPKPSQLAFDTPALNTPVSLSGVATLGDLVRRVGQAARLELYADPRVAKLPVGTRGTTARAGDVLRALCLAVTGTFRKVGYPLAGAAFVLTDDIVGIGTRHAALSEWLFDSDAAKEEAFPYHTFEKQIMAQNPAQYLQFAPGDPLALDPATVRKLVERQQNRYRTGRGYVNSPEDFSVAELPPALRRHVGELAAREAGRNHPLRTETVGLDLTTQLSYLVPGVGTIDARRMEPEASFNKVLLSQEPSAPGTPGSPATAAPRLKPASLPAAFAARALYVAPASPEEAARAVEEAQKRGFNQLWVEAPEAGGDERVKQASPLRRAIAAGKGKNLPVFAVVRLLKTAGKDPGDAAADLRDVNLMGETSGAYAQRRAASPGAKRGEYTAGAIEHILGHSGDWARFDTPVLVARLTRRLADLANTPGLAGLVLRDTAGPGYTIPGDDDWYYGLRDSGDFGYTPELRLAFLRQEGYDPVDLSFSGSWRAGADLSLPFFPDDGAPPRVVPPASTNTPVVKTPVERWRAFRYETNTHFMEQLYAALRRAHPELALLLKGRANAAFRGQLDWYGSWDRADALPDPSPNPHSNDPSQEQTARSRSKRVLKDLRFAPSDILEEHWSNIRGILNDAAESGWDGIVFDMSEMRFDKAVSLLNEGVLAPVTGTGK